MGRSRTGNFNVKTLDYSRPMMFYSGHGNGRVRIIYPDGRAIWLAGLVDGPRWFACCFAVKNNYHNGFYRLSSAGKKKKHEFIFDNSEDAVMAMIDYDKSECLLNKETIFIGYL